MGAKMSTLQKQKFVDSEFVTDFPNHINDQSPSGELALIYRPPVPPWMSEATSKIVEFQSYQDDWDFEGSKSFTGDCIKQAINFLGHIIKRPNLPKPNIVSGYHNDIVFFWARNGQELQVSVMSDGSFWLSSRKSLEKFSGPDASPKANLYEAREQFDLLSLKIM